MLTDFERITNLARAHVFWGARKESIRNYLLQNGLSEKEADGLIIYWFSERSKEVRKKGVQRLIEGWGMLIVGWGMATAFSLQILPTKISVIGIILGIFGIFTVVDGFEMLLRSSRIKGSVTEM